MGEAALEANLQKSHKVVQSINQFNLFFRNNKMGKYTQQYKYQCKFINCDKMIAKKL